MIAFLVFSLLLVSSFSLVYFHIVLLYYHMDQMVLVVSQVGLGSWLMLVLLGEDVVLMIQMWLVTSLHDLVFLVTRMVQRRPVSVLLVLTYIHDWVHLLILVSVLVHTPAVVVHIVWNDDFHL